MHRPAGLSYVMPQSLEIRKTVSPGFISNTSTFFNFRQFPAGTYKLEKSKCIRMQFTSADHKHTLLRAGSCVVITNRDLSSLQINDDVTEHSYGLRDKFSLHFQTQLRSRPLRPP